jgi:hypothetical protein
MDIDDPEKRKAKLNAFTFLQTLCCCNVAGV